MSICELRIKAADFDRAVAMTPPGGMIHLANLPAGVNILKPPHQVGEDIVMVYEDPSEPLVVTVGLAQPTA